MLEVNENAIGSKPILCHLILGLLPGVLVVEPNTRLTPIPQSMLGLVLVSDSKGMLRTCNIR